MKKIEELKSSTLGRGLFAARSSLRMLPSLLKGETDPRQLLASFLGGKVELFVDEVGELKGGLLKAAQILSLYGEYYLPAEVNALLKRVQYQSHFLAWEKVRELIPQNFHDQLEIDTAPLAAASIGQVHRARVRASGAELVLKIQYPGIRKAIDLDMGLIKMLVNLGQWLPKKVNMDGIYGEIRRVLIEEMDYEAEARKHVAYRARLSSQSSILVPQLYPEFCTTQVLASEYVPGRSLSELALADLSQAERDELGAAFFNLFFYEIFCSPLIQTDCHPGNYQVHNGKIVVLDFGAVLEYPPSTLKTYRNLISAVFRQDRAGFFGVLERDVGGIRLDENILWRYCLMAASPMWSESFDWGTTKLPDEITPLAMELVKSSRIDTPPHEFIFLDRKLLGLFSILRSLKCRFNVQQIVRQYVP